ncbi:hypothetical protein [Deinococcus frigens]|uniref:hypothetical protein n=1 Tax=Deinococcus frigens TaxID=249403 RepID=UPI0004959AAC|nr:hypothetical protein [Deinococcus frigens]
MTQETAQRIQWLKDRYADLHPNVYTKLLEAGGDAAVMAPLGWFETAFLTRAELSNDPVRKGQGRGNQCHLNTASYYRKNPQRYRIVSGFGLNQDSDGVGCWRSHSWVFDTKTKEIVETVFPRDLYYGVLLTDEEAEAFAAQYDQS